MRRHATERSTSARPESSNRAAAILDSIPAASLLLLAAASGWGCTPTPPPPQGGIVLESVAPRGALQRAGLAPRDRIIAWQGPKGTATEIDSIFHWLELGLEQAPRQAIRLTAVRDGKVRRFRVSAGGWRAEARPSMAPEMLIVYEHGRRLLKDDEPLAAARHWHEQAEGLQPSDPLRHWLLLTAADAFREARETDQAASILRSLTSPAATLFVRVLAWNQLGELALQSHRFEPAKAAFEAARELLRKEGGPDRLGLVESSFRLGNLALYRGHVGEAETAYQEAMDRAIQLAPESLVLAQALASLASVADSRGRLEEAKRLYAESLSLRRRLLPESMELARNLHNLGVVTIRQGHLDEAEALFLEARDLQLRLEPASIELATSLDSLAMVALRRGDLDAAQDLAQHSLRLLERLEPESLKTAYSFNNLGVIAHDRGDLHDAERYYMRALELRESLAPGSLDLSHTLNNLGTLTLSWGDLPRSRHYFERALEITQSISPDSELAAAMLNNLGKVAQRMEDLDQAETYLRRAFEIKEQLVPDSLSLANAWAALAQLALEKGQLDDAETGYQRALEIRQRLAPGGLAEAESLYGLGEVATKRGRGQEAEDLFRRTLARRQLLAPATTAVAESHAALGALAHARGAKEEALEHYLQTLDALEGQYGKVGGSEVDRRQFRSRYSKYYRRTLEVQIELGRPQDALHTLERSRARGFLAMLAERRLRFSADLPPALAAEMDQLDRQYDASYRKLARLRPEQDPRALAESQEELRRLQRRREVLAAEIRRTAPAVAALHHPRPLDLAGIQETLEHGTALLSYSVGTERTFLFVVTRSQLQVEALEIGEAELARQVELFRRLIQGQTAVTAEAEARRRALLSTGQRLYGLLLRPAQASIAAAERLLLVPDGPLHLLPFAVLMSDDQRFLAQQKPMVFSHSATALAEIRVRSNRQRLEEHAAAEWVGFGDPIFNSAGGSPNPATTLDGTTRRLHGQLGKLEPLRFSRLEIEGIRRLYGPARGQAFLGDEATEGRAKDVSADARILHFATHSLLDQQFPLSSSLVLSIPGSEAEGENGLLQGWEVLQDLRLQADLVVLSACQTALGQHQSGEGLLGLTQAFQFAGAPAVLASLWNVEDQATATLMGHFYRQLQNGKSTAEALRAAQIEMIHQIGKASTAPLGWAAFQIYGDWH